MNLFMSCSVSKQLHQDKTTTKTEIATKENTVATSQVISVTKITEKADTSVLVPGAELSGVVSLRSLISGDTLYATNDGLSVKTFYDSLTKTVKSQARVNPKVVTVHINIVTEKQEIATGTVTTNKQETSKQYVQTENKDKQVERSSLPWWLIILGAIIILAGIAFSVLKFKRYL